MPNIKSKNPRDPKPFTTPEIDSDWGTQELHWLNLKNSKDNYGRANPMFRVLVEINHRFCIPVRLLPVFNQYSALFKIKDLAAKMGLKESGIVQSYCLFTKELHGKRGLSGYSIWTLTKADVMRNEYIALDFFLDWLFFLSTDSRICTPALLKITVVGFFFLCGSVDYLLSSFQNQNATCQSIAEIAVSLRPVPEMEFFRGRWIERLGAQSTNFTADVALTGKKTKARTLVDFMELKTQKFNPEANFPILNTPANYINEKNINITTTTTTTTTTTVPERNVENYMLENHLLVPEMPIRNEGKEEQRVDQNEKAEDSDLLPFLFAGDDEWLTFNILDNPHYDPTNYPKLEWSPLPTNETNN
jgi:hypothetical protein